MKIYSFLFFIIFALGCGTHSAKSKSENISNKSYAKREESPQTPKTPKSGLLVGYADDNQQFNYFTHFLEKKLPQVSSSTVQKINIEERIKFMALDNNDKPIANARVKIYAPGNKLVNEGKTHADGSFLFFPSEVAAGVSNFTAKLSYSGKTLKKEFKLEDYLVKAKFNFAREDLQGIHVDTVFILDVSSSMADELEQIKTAIKNSCSQLTSAPITAKFKFGMVLYRDSEDKKPKVIPLTEELDDFLAKLQNVKAEGGLDRPENLQLALEQAVKMEWNINGVRNAFIITDAPPQALKYNAYTYAQAAKAAKKEGIKIFSIGTSGLDLTGEYILRQISQYTSGKYIFLTYSKEENKGKIQPKKVSFHVEHDYDKKELEELIKELIIHQLENLLEPEKEKEEEYFLTTENKDPFENKIDISEMATRFQPVIDRLFERLQKQSRGPLEIFLRPIKAEEKGLLKVAKKLDESLKIAFVNSKNYFKVYEFKKDASLNKPQAEGKLFASIKDITLRLNLWDIKGKLKEYLSATTVKILKNKKYSMVIESEEKKASMHQKLLLAAVQQTLSKQFSVYYHHELEKKLKQRSNAFKALAALNIQDHMILKFFGKDLTTYIETKIIKSPSSVEAKIRCRIEDNIFANQYFDKQITSAGANEKEAINQASILLTKSLQNWIETKFSDINNSICILGYLQEQEEQTKLRQTLLELQKDGFITLNKTLGSGTVKPEYHISIIKEQTNVENLSQIIEERMEIEGISLKISTFSRLLHIVKAQEEEDD